MSPWTKMTSSPGPQHDCLQVYTEAYLGDVMPLQCYIVLLGTLARHARILAFLRSRGSGQQDLPDLPITTTQQTYCDHASARTFVFHRSDSSATSRNVGLHATQRIEISSLRSVGRQRSCCRNIICAVCNTVGRQQKLAIISSFRL